MDSTPEGDQKENNSKTQCAIKVFLVFFSTHLDGTYNDAVIRFSGRMLDISSETFTFQFQGGIQIAKMVFSDLVDLACESYNPGR